MKGIKYLFCRLETSAEQGLKAKAMEKSTENKLKIKSGSRVTMYINTNKCEYINLQQTVGEVLRQGGILSSL